MKAIAYLIFLLKNLSTAVLASSCPSTQYTGRFRSEDYENDKAIVGHSYKNLTITYAQECFGYCVSDCRCLSYQISGTRCELLDEDKNALQRAGYKYYVLKQHFKYNNINCSGGCRNGCCHSNPCMNGGTCVETCEDVRRKFKCICPLGTQGRYCEFIVSCAGIPGKPKSGVHTITRPSLTSQLKVYCDFTSEPDYVWTLVESFEYSKKMNYFYWKLFEDHPVNESSPNWVNYRLSLEDMTHIRTNATHWRVTCNFESADFSNSDYVRVDMKTLDLLQQISTTCHQPDFLRLQGTTCTGNCKTLYRHDKYHPYFAPCLYNNCKFVGCSGHTYEAFGAYEVVNRLHHCSSSPKSTTNWWIGYKLN
ncbi:uncharacterized protein LOC116297426 [Actinia tenebrosa]|uniref:Uncharacterized protein LOC116297426 n=1 Tax=Actinia tenebrosa TaxID=6105 RepID=A0A6P8HYQ2_ACTTE|nr:uncharacterized protein LOC116297426 [Actinia tenebrosa]